MKKAYLSFFAATALLLVSCGGGEEKKEEKKDGKQTEEKKDEKAEPVTYGLDTAASNLVWHGKHSVKEEKHHEGTADLVSGTLTMEGDAVKSGKFVVDLTTIKSTDLEGKMAENLIGHLMSPDFFNVEAHPKATFVILGQDKGIISAELEVAGGKVAVNNITTSPKVDGDKVTVNTKFDVNFKDLELPGFQPEEGKEDQGHVDHWVTFEADLVMNKQ